MKLFKVFLAKLILVTGFWSIRLQAQENSTNPPSPGSPVVQDAKDSQEDDEIKSVESELEKNIPKRTEPVGQKTVVVGKKQDVVELDSNKNPRPRSQIVVIQKNYMPKSGRFNLSGGITLFPSDVFFKTYGAQLKASYHFNETWGAELSGILLTSSKSAELQDLEGKQSVTANNLATLKNYFGANLYYSNSYGKYALSDRKIFPFEIYETLGFGSVVTDKSSSPAISLGVGQLLSLSRNDALRVDLSLLFYQTETLTTEKQQATSLLVSISYANLFPWVGRR